MLAIEESGINYHVLERNENQWTGPDGKLLYRSGWQPIEHLASFRAMPNILMFRPADGNETAGAYKVAVLNRKRPSVLALSRQKLPQLAGTSIDAVAKGGYTVR